MCSNSETAEEAAREGLKIAQEAWLGDDSMLELPVVKIDQQIFHCHVTVHCTASLDNFFLVDCCLLLLPAMSPPSKKHEVGDKSLEASMLCISSEVNMVP